MSAQFVGPAGPTPAPPRNLAAQWYYDDYGSDSMSTKGVVIIGVAVVLIGIIVLMHRETIFPQVQSASNVIIEKINETVGMRNNTGWTPGYIALVGLCIAVVIGIIIGLIEFARKTGFTKKQEALNKVEQGIGAVNNFFEEKALREYNNRKGAHASDPKYVSRDDFADRAEKAVYDKYVSQAMRDNKEAVDILSYLEFCEHVLRSFTFRFTPIEKRQVEEALKSIELSLPDFRDDVEVTTWLGERSTLKRIRKTVLLNLVKSIDHAELMNMVSGSSSKEDIGLKISYIR